MKKVLSILSLIAGGLVLLSAAAPVIIESIVRAKTVAGSVSIIGGADGPTAVVLVGTIGRGSMAAEMVIGLLLIAAGIWGLRKKD